MKYEIGAAPSAFLPELALGAPGHLVALDVARDVIGAGQEAGIVPAGRVEFGGDTFGCGGWAAGRPRKLSAVACARSRDLSCARTAGLSPQTSSRYWERAAWSGRSRTARKISSSVIAQPSGGRARSERAKNHEGYSRVVGTTHQGGRFQLSSGGVLQTMRRGAEITPDICEDSGSAAVRRPARMPGAAGTAPSRPVCAGVERGADILVCPTVLACNSYLNSPLS